MSSFFAPGHDIPLTMREIAVLGRRAEGRKERGTRASPGGRVRGYCAARSCREATPEPITRFRPMLFAA